MKQFSLIVLAVALAVSAGAQITMQPTNLVPLKTDAGLSTGLQPQIINTPDKLVPLTSDPGFSNAVAALSDTNPPAAVVAGDAVAEFTASAATLTAPLVLTNDFIVLTNDAMADEVTNGGKAVFTFTLTNAGYYVLAAVVHAPDDNANSYFVNIDAMPADEMIWDVTVTPDDQLLTGLPSGFTEQLVNWRGTGDAANDEFNPKLFKLEAGKHQLILTGREPGTVLKSIAVCRAMLFHPGHDLPTIITNESMIPPHGAIP